MDPKFQPLVDDLKAWLELEEQKKSAKAAGLNSAMDAFRPTASYLGQLGKELKSNVDPTISIGQIGRWNEAIAEFEELLKMDPTWNLARPCLYNALKAVGRNAEAQKVYEDDQKYKAMGYP